MTQVHLPFTPEWLLWPQPWVWALVGIPLLGLLWPLWLRPQRRAALRYSAVGELRGAAGRWPRRWQLLLPALRTGALACLLVAVARPQIADESSRQYAEGVAIQMVVDTSSSMEDDDLATGGRRQTRLDVVKDVFRRFVAGDPDDGLPGRKNDLIGMIRFARFADSVAPLTLDHKVLLDALETVQLVPPNSPENGTAIGDGLALAVERLRNLTRTAGSGEQLTIRSRIAILLTDGENNLGEVTPEQAGELAATHKIKVYTIMAGTGARQGWRRMPVDDSVLRRIAEVTGGKHYAARDAAALEGVYREIDALERTKIEERHYLRFGDLGGPWLLAAFVLVCVQMFADATWLRRIP